MSPSSAQANLMYAYMNEAVGQGKEKIVIQWISAHVGILGNEMYLQANYCVQFVYWRIRGRDDVDSTAEEKVLGCACAMQACGKQDEPVKHVAIGAGLFLVLKFKLYTLRVSNI